MGLGETVAVTPFGRPVTATVTGEVKLAAPEAKIEMDAVPPGFRITSASAANNIKSRGVTVRSTFAVATW